MRAEETPVDAWWFPTAFGRPTPERRAAERARSRAVLRQAAAAHLGVDRRDVLIDADANGRPTLTVAGVGVGVGVGVGLSRCPGRAVAVLCRSGVVGVDVECTGRDLDHEVVARRFFSPVENAELKALPPARARARFFELWTWKEAVVKAAGVGLRAPLPTRCDGGPTGANVPNPLLRAENSVTTWPEPGFVLTVVTADANPCLRWNTTAPNEGVR